MNLSQDDLKGLLRSTETIIKEVGSYIRENWEKVHTVTLKNKRDSVTELDIEVENKLRSKLNALLPSAGFIVEEGKTERLAEYNWVIDPIDGTKNLVGRLPLFITQLALLRNETPILGQMYFPVPDHLFSAAESTGSFLNGIKLIPEYRTDPQAAIIDLDFGGNDDRVEWKLKIVSLLIKNAYRVRMFGGFGTPYLLTGAFDGFVDFTRPNKQKYIVDNAPKVIILKEGGVRLNHIIAAGQEVVFAACPPISDYYVNLLSFV